MLHKYLVVYNLSKCLRQPPHRALEGRVPKVVQNRHQNHPKWRLGSVLGRLGASWVRKPNPAISKSGAGGSTRTNFWSHLAPLSRFWAPFWSQVGAKGGPKIALWPPKVEKKSGWNRGGGYPPKKKNIKNPLVFPLFLRLGGGWIPPTRHLERSWDRLLRFLCVSEGCRFLMRFSIDKKSAQNRKNRPTGAYTHRNVRVGSESALTPLP